MAVDRDDEMLARAQKQRDDEKKREEARTAARKGEVDDWLTSVIGDEDDGVGC